MNTNGDLHVVLGATGGIGSALVGELVDAATWSAP